MDHIDRMIVIEVLQIRKEANAVRQELGLPIQDYEGVPQGQALQEPKSTK